MWIFSIPVSYTHLDVYKRQAFTVISTVLINVCAFAIAIVLTRGIKGTNIFRTVYFMPNLIGGILLGYIWQILLNGVLANLQKPLLALDRCV